METRRQRLTIRRLFWRVRDALVAWGWVAPPRFYMNRHPAGAVRGRLRSRGAAGRIRRLPLTRLLT